MPEFKILFCSSTELNFNDINTLYINNVIRIKIFHGNHPILKVARFDFVKFLSGDLRVEIP